MKTKSWSYGLDILESILSNWRCCNNTLADEPSRFTTHDTFLARSDGCASERRLKFEILTTLVGSADSHSPILLFWTSKCSDQGFLFKANHYLGWW